MPASATSPAVRDAARLEVRCRVISASPKRFSPHAGAHFPAIRHWTLFQTETAGDTVTTRQHTHHLALRGCVVIPPWIEFDYNAVEISDTFQVVFDPMDISEDWVREYFTSPVVLLAEHLREPVLAELERQHITTLVARTRIQALALKCLAGVFETLPSSAIDPGSSHGVEWSLIKPVLTHIDVHLRQKISVVKMAAIAGVSPIYFAKMFRRLTGKSPMHYLRERRIGEAAERLTHTGDSIDLICAETGFANRCHFTRVFEASKGVPPARYRRTMHVRPGSTFETCDAPNEGE
jgi:AraC-like DNA-binding protein